MELCPVDLGDTPKNTRVYVQFYYIQTCGRQVRLTTHVRLRAERMCMRCLQIFNATTDAEPSIRVESVQCIAEYICARACEFNYHNATKSVVDDNTVRSSSATAAGALSACARSVCAYPNKWRRETSWTGRQDDRDMRILTRNYVEIVLNGTKNTIWTYQLRTTYVTMSIPE